VEVPLAYGFGCAVSASVVFSTAAFAAESITFWDHWQANSPTIGPVDQVAMLEEFARILDLSGHFQWGPDPSMGGAPELN